MDKRYQVFISSTYADLQEERRYVDKEPSIFLSLRIL